MDIIITKDSFRTFEDVIIADFTCTNLVQCVSMTIMHVVIVVAQDKT
jgi:hypothetical protein